MELRAFVTTYSCTLTWDGIQGLIFICCVTRAELCKCCRWGWNSVQYSFAELSSFELVQNPVQSMGKLSNHTTARAIILKTRVSGLLITPKLLVTLNSKRQWLESWQANGGWVGFNGRYRVKRGCYFLPLSLELHLPYHS